jgi:hypothetical protein
VVEVNERFERVEVSASSLMLAGELALLVELELCPPKVDTGIDDGMVDGELFVDF